MSSTDAVHPSAQRVVEKLRSKGVTGPFPEFAASTKTTDDAAAAAALECEVGAIAGGLGSVAAATRWS